MTVTPIFLSCRTNMENIEIRRVTTKDIDNLRQIGRQTFSETFAPGNTEENLANYLEDGFSDNKLMAELQNAGSEFYFAEAANNIIGYLKLNFGASQTELNDPAAMEIERIYVIKEYHGREAGQVLYNTAIRIAKERHCQYVWLGVWEENPRAIRFYKKNGFTEFDKHIFRLGNEEQTDIMMRLDLG